MTVGQMILAAGALLTAGIAATLIAGRLRLPGLVLFLGLGMLVGSDSLGWVEFDNSRLARTIGIIALALILFEGGLTAGFSDLRPVAWPAASLAFVGTLLTAAIAGVAAQLLFGFTVLEAMLVGSILAGTDGAAVFALLRGSTLRRRLAATLAGGAGGGAAGGAREDARGGVGAERPGGRPSGRGVDRGDQRAALQRRQRRLAVRAPA